MRVVVTGAAGFIGGVVVRQLSARGDQVVAVVRDPARASGLAELGVEVARSDLGQVDEIARLLAGADALIHIAGVYRIGIRPADRPAMLDANLGVTTRVLDAAAQAGTPRIVYTSTVLVLGDTHGKAADETHQRDPAEGFFSYYDETKFRAHELVIARIAAGAPIMVGMPGGVYGPGDHSEAGGQFALAYAGKMPYVALADIGLGWTYVDDVADGLVRILDRGRLGESYLLSGPPGRLRDGLQVAARLGGKRLPRLTLPTRLLRLQIGRASCRERVCVPV